MIVDGLQGEGIRQSRQRHATASPRLSCLSTLHGRMGESDAWYDVTPSHVDSTQPARIIGSPEGESPFVGC